MNTNTIIRIIFIFIFAASTPIFAQWMQTSGPNGFYVSCFAVLDTNIFAGTMEGGVFLSTNNGTSWTAVNSGLTNNDIRSLAISGTNIFAGTGGGVFLTTNSGTSWTNSGLTNTSIRSLAISGTNIFAGGWGVFLSTNNGTSWTSVNSGLTDSSISSLTVSGTNIFAGTWQSGVFLSTNNGTSWTAVNSGLTDITILSFAISGTNIFAGTWGGYVNLTTNNGTSWTSVSSGLPNYSSIMSLAVSGTSIFAGTEYGGVYLSTNNGTSWSEVNSGLMNNYIVSLAVSGTNIFAGTWGSGVWLRPLMEIIPVELTSFTASVKPGGHVVLNWSTATELNNRIFEIERRPVDDGQFMTIGFVEGRGTTTEPQNYNFADNNVSPGTYGYRLKQIDFDGSFEYLNEIMVDVPPSDFELNQNYPNPFNPSTTISWQSPADGHQTLKVFDVLGNEVAVLVDEFRSAGRYEATFDAGNLASGIYLYKLQAGDYIQTKKMILMK
jgi:hypothetical protein